MAEYKFFLETEIDGEKQANYFQELFADTRDAKTPAFGKDKAKTFNNPRDAFTTAFYEGSEAKKTKDYSNATIFIEEIDGDEVKIYPLIPKNN